LEKYVLLQIQESFKRFIQLKQDLSKITMPAAWCEPLSILQRVAENLSSSHLLDLANEQLDQCKRLEYVAAFSVSCTSSLKDRLSKPFNPLLGETYELTREDLGFRFVSEQVSHHVRPSISLY
jgi:oxysterol-binding protein-related protein 1/2